MPPGNKSRVSASTPISRTDMLTFLHCNESNQTQIEMKLRRFDVESGERLKQRSITIYGIIEHRLLVASKLYSMVEKSGFPRFGHAYSSTHAINDKYTLEKRTIRINVDRVYSAHGNQCANLNK